MRNDLRADKFRHANRLPEQLQRYYPQMLQLGCDLAEERFLKLREAAPTPADAAQLCQEQAETLLQSHRVRRIGAAKVLGVLNQPALTVAQSLGRR